LSRSIGSKRKDMSLALTYSYSARTATTRRKLRDYSLVLIGFAFLMLCLTFVNGVRGLTIVGSPFAGDFVGFYSAGQIVNEYSFHRLYDLELQNQLVHKTLPDVPPGWTLPFVQPPFVALIFSPLARLPMWLAYLCWLVITCLLYSLSIWFVLKAYPELSDETTICLCLVFPPFLMVLAGGQLSAIGCLIISGWIYLMKTDRRLLAGLVLGLLLYKPTMVLLVAPTLVFGRQIKPLFGFAVTATVLLGACVLLIGPSGIEHYISTLREFSQSVTRGEVFSSRYIDLNSFARQLFHVDLKLWGLVLVPPLAFLLRRNPERAIVPTLLLSTYAPTYDVLMLAPVLIASHRVLKPRWLVIIFVATSITTPICQLTGFQLLTPMLIALTVILIWNPLSETSSQPRV
jgi:Glycosyltransferase family 87